MSDVVAVVRPFLDEFLFLVYFLALELISPFDLYLEPLIPFLYFGAASRESVGCVECSKPWLFINGTFNFNDFCSLPNKCS